MLVQKTIGPIILVKTLSKKIWSRQYLVQENCTPLINLQTNSASKEVIPIKTLSDKILV